MDSFTADPACIIDRDGLIVWASPSFVELFSHRASPVGMMFNQLFPGLTGACRHGVQVGYHNHAGYVGAPVWDVVGIIEKLDSKWAGYYYDIRHAVVEGGGIGWKVSTQLVSPRLKMIAVKDFYWDKIPGKGWQQINCPLGQGMVDWPGFCGMLANSGFQGPVSIHLEYGIPGANKTQKQDNTILAAKRDLEFVRKCIAAAYTPSNGKKWDR